MKTIKNIFSVGNYLQFENIEFLSTLKTEPQLTIEYQHDSTLLESYRIKVKSNYAITITHGNARSKKYAIKSLGELLQKNALPIGIIEDGPSMEIRGIIEGFYGTPWTHEDRLDVIDFLEKEDMNCYIYAPKDDLYHRDKWRVPYPKDNFDKLLELIEESKKKDIDFYFSISPGKDFNYSKEEDFNALFEKIDAIANHGVTHYCLLLDDIDYKLEGTDLSQFQTPGKAHAYISNRLNTHLDKTLDDFNLIMCPTEYWQNTNTPYREDIKTHLDENIMVFWTGYNTIAEFIPNSDGKNVKEYFGHELILWDNYPVNDVTNDLIFMGPLENRGDELHHSHKGMVSNPMIEWSLSKLSILTMSDYMWNPAGYDKDVSYQNAIKRFVKDKKLYGSFKNVMDNFRYSIIHYYPVEELNKAIEDKNVKKIHEYYVTLLADVKKIRSIQDERFLEQITPWLERIEFDAEVVRLINLKELSKVKELLNEVQDKKHTVGSNIAIKLAKKMDLYDGPIYKKYRINFWE